MRNEKDLAVISQRELENSVPNNTLYQALTIEVFHNGEFRRFLGDTDLVVYLKNVKLSWGNHKL